MYKILAVGIEPTRYFYHRILSPERLPVSPCQLIYALYHIFFKKSRTFLKIFKPPIPQSDTLFKPLFARGNISNIDLIL